jgi:serine/threonine protein kinase
MDHPNVI